MAFRFLRCPPLSEFSVSLLPNTLSHESSINSFGNRAGKVGRLFEDVEQRLRAVNAVALGICRPPQNPQTFQPADCSLCRGEGDTEFAGNARGGNEGIGGQQFDDPQGGIGGLASDLSLPLGKNYVDTTCTAQRVLRCASDSDQEVFQPIVPGSALTHVSQPLVVVALCRFKERRQVQQGSGQNLLLDQEQRNQQASHPAIAVQKWMYSLKLVVSEGNRHQRRQIGFVKELLPGRETGCDFTGRRWDEGGGCQRAPPLPNPSLHPPEPP